MAFWPNAADHFSGVMRSGMRFHELRAMLMKSIGHVEQIVGRCLLVRQNKDLLDHEYE